ncbi:MAG: hypothetical protein Q8M83_00060 [bacterium]|nr:hypothetical protein [bacterium]
MYYKLSSQQEDQLLHLPETGMGYQVVEASKQGNYTKERFLVLNSEIVIDINGSESKYIRTIINEGIFVRFSAFENDRRVDKVEIACYREVSLNNG